PGLCARARRHAGVLPPSLPEEPRELHRRGHEPQPESDRRAPLDWWHAIRTPTGRRREARSPVPAAARAAAARRADAAADARRVRRPGAPRRRARPAPTERRPRPSQLDAAVGAAGHPQDEPPPPPRPADPGATPEPD